MLPLTPARLAGVYEMLRAFPPYNRWSLPPSAKIKFHVLNTPHLHGDWWIDGSKHHIRLSKKKHGHLSSLVESMAHEMIHARQRVNRTETSGAEHNAEFHRLAKLVCKRFGFDYGQFLG
jgi:hypothetical protein